MALSVKTNQITGPASAGSSATTDPAFQPKALILWAGLQTATGAVANAQFSLGVTSSSTTENAVGYNSLDVAATSDVVRNFNNLRILEHTNAGTTTVNNSVSFTSFDVNGFTLNFNTLNTVSPIFNYLAIGGSDITNVMSGNFAANTTTGNQAVTGVGFQPDIIFLFITLQSASGTSNNNSCASWGVATANGNQWATGVRLQNAQATMNTGRSFHSDRCLYTGNAGSNTVENEADFVSMDSDGFTINWIDPPGAAFLVGYLAIKGGQWKVGTDTQKASTGTKATTGVGFTPQAVMFASHCDATPDTIIDHARTSLGATDGTRNVALWTGDRDNVADSIANTIMSNTKCLIMATEGTSATPTTQAEANISSLDSDGFTLDWTTADATARVFGYVAIGATATGTVVKDLIQTGFIPFAR